MEKQRLIDALNEDLAGELGAVIQYLTYSAKVTGPHRPELSEFLRAEIADELGHAQFLADKIVALGGEPTVRPRPVPQSDDNRQMIQYVLEAERQAIRDYTQRARQAAEFGDVGLQVRLEDIVADETTHAEESEKLLRWWPEA